MGGNIPRRLRTALGELCILFHLNFLVVPLTESWPVGVLTCRYVRASAMYMRGAH